MRLFAKTALLLSLLFGLSGPALSEPPPQRRPTSRPTSAEAATQPASAPATRPTTAPAATPPAKADDDDVEEVETVVAVADDRSRWFGEAYVQRDRFIALHAPAPVGHLSLRFSIDHRTIKPLSEDTFHDFLGFDGGLKVGLGLRFGLWDRVDLGVYRLNNGGEAFDTYQLDSKVSLLSQRRYGVDLGLRAGISWFVQKDAEDAVGFFGQLLVRRRFAQRLTVGAGLLFHSESTNSVKSNRDDAASLAAQLALSLRITGRLAWDLEAAYALAGYTTRQTEGVNAYPTLSTALTFITNRHSFALVLSNNPYTTADGVVANTPRGFDELVIGFSIARQWDFAKR